MNTIDYKTLRSIPLSCEMEDKVNKRQAAAAAATARGAKFKWRLKKEVGLSVSASCCYFLLCREACGLNNHLIGNSEQKAPHSLNLDIRD